MRWVIIPAAVVSAAIALTVARPEASRQTQPAAPIDPIVLKWDAGPTKIDVSKYPEDMKRRYKVFEEVCGRCHTLARAINCDFVLDDEWERYVKKMMRRGRGIVTPEQGLQTFEFGVYDSQRRKRELYEKKLAANR
jgi:hypothetical protein